MSASDVALIMAFIMQKKGIPVGDSVGMAKLRNDSQKSKQQKELDEFMASAKWV